MRLLAPAQFFLIPLSLVCSLGGLYSALHQYNVKEVSATAGTRGAIEAWAKTETRAQQCLPWSVDLDVETESGDWPTPDSGPWFATLRCNQHRIYYRLALVFLGPWIALNLLVGLMGIMTPPSRTKHG